ncbi:head decoration protein [bacterium]|nr:MAG: head decoration protein [bacterium]
MALITEKRRAGSALVSEASGTRSRENIVVVSGQNLGACRVLGKITASGKHTALNPAASDGSQTAAGMLWGPTDATTGDKAAAAIVRDAELNSLELDWGSLNSGQITTAKGQLAALGILVREAI